MNTVQCGTFKDKKDKNAKAVITLAAKHWRLEISTAYCYRQTLDTASTHVPFSARVKTFCPGTYSRAEIW